MFDEALTTPLGVKGRQQRLLTAFILQSGDCYYCKRPMYLDHFAAGATKSNRATIEHLVPQSLGGCSCAVNLVAACRRCNDMRGRIPIPIFLKLLAKVFETSSFYAAWHDDSRKAREVLKRVIKIFAKASNTRVPPTITWPSSLR